MPSAILTLCGQSCSSDHFSKGFRENMRIFFLSCLKEQMQIDYTATCFGLIWSDGGSEVLINLHILSDLRPLLRAWALWILPLPAFALVGFLINSFQRTFPLLFLGGMVITVLLTISGGKRGEEEQRRANWTRVARLADAWAKQTNFNYEHQGGGQRSKQMHHLAI